MAVKLNAEEVILHVSHRWTLYCSKVKESGQCKFWFNGNKEYKVTIGTDIQETKYKGQDLELAVRVYNEL